MTPLVRIVVPSIYESHGVAVPLPIRMAQCTADTKHALGEVAAALKAKGGALVLSDLFRSYDMQLGSYMDYVSGKKSAFSPPPGGSLHEAGRALDLDLGALKMSLAEFWKLAVKHGLTPIIDTPNAAAKEAWHFECRGSHAIVYDYYKAGKGDNFAKPYQAMAASSIVAVGVKVDKFGTGQRDAYAQSGLIRLGFELGNLDGQTGPKTRDAMTAAGIAGLSPADTVSALDNLLQQKFAREFFDKSVAIETIA